MKGISSESVCNEINFIDINFTELNCAWISRVEKNIVQTLKRKL